MVNGYHGIFTNCDDLSDNPNHCPVDIDTRNKHPIKVKHNFFHLLF